MRIEFDAAKRTATLEARGLDMARAEEVLTGATLTVEDDRRSYGGTASSPSVFSTAPWWSSSTPGDGAYRIVSMRKANERERRLYGRRF